MNIAILGAGNIGGTLGRRWAERGHHIRFGVRNPHDARVEALLAELPGAQAGSVAEAVAFGDVVLLAVSGGAAVEVVTQVANWDGKILVDATNGPPRQHPSLVEDIAATAVGARVVKAFNTAGFEVLDNPHFGDLVADTFICGDDAEAKAVVTNLARGLGLEVRDVGGLANARLLEALAFLWIHLAMRGGLGREIGFKVLTR